MTTAVLPVPTTIIVIPFLFSRSSLVILPIIISNSATATPQAGANGIRRLVVAGRRRRGRARGSDVIFRPNTATTTTTRV
jgi:hypothetical protein